MAAIALWIAGGSLEAGSPRVEPATARRPSEVAQPQSPTAPDTSRLIRAFEGTETPTLLSYSDFRNYALRYGKYVVAVTEVREAVGETIRVYPRIKVGPGRRSPIVTVTEDEGWLFGVAGDYLFVDVGCCPHPRGLVIYNLARRKRWFEGSYDTDSLTLRQGRWLRYAEPVDDVASKPECPEDARLDWKAADLDVGYDEEVTLDLLTRTVKRSGRVWCAPRQ